MSDLSEIRDGIKTVLRKQVPGLAVYRYGREAQWDYPCLVIEPQEEDGAYNTIAGNPFEQVLLLTVRVVSASRDEAYEELDKYRSPTGDLSIRAAIATDRTLDGKADDAQVGWGIIPDRDEDSSDVYLCELPIKIIKTVA